MLWPQFQQSLSGSAEAIGHDAHTGIVKPTRSSSIEQFPWIPIPIIESPPRASGGSGEGGTRVGGRI